MAESAKRRQSKIKRGGRLDITFLSLVLILLTIGLVMLFSASYAYSLAYYDNSYKFITRQAAFGAVGVVAMLVFSKIDYHIWRKFAWIIYAVTIIMLGALLILPPMVSGMDVKRWLVIGPINFQPSEVAKIASVLYL
ncbi:MAG: FtsW/RodA/SpoVE family cell cycle protein, partial [Clostridia bacterium]|nr:FtsW/RodA/SpoVE family cell cycle protein [Clostridia bacterium]